MNFIRWVFSSIAGTLLGIVVIALIILLPIIGVAASFVAGSVAIIFFCIVLIKIYLDEKRAEKQKDHHEV